MCSAIRRVRSFRLCSELYQEVGRRLNLFLQYENTLESEMRGDICTPHKSSDARGFRPVECQEEEHTRGTQRLQLPDLLLDLDLFLISNNYIPSDHSLAYVA